MVAMLINWLSGTNTQDECHRCRNWEPIPVEAPPKLVVKTPPTPSEIVDSAQERFMRESNACIECVQRLGRSLDRNTVATSKLAQLTETHK